MQVVILFARYLFSEVSVCKYTSIFSHNAKYSIQIFINHSLLFYCIKHGKLL